MQCRLELDAMTVRASCGCFLWFRVSVEWFEFGFSIRRVLI